MNHRPHLRRLACTLLAAGAATSVLGGCTETSTFEATSITADPVRPSDAAATGANVLFVARAERGNVVLDRDGRGTLTLDRPGDVTWFTDRPDRDAGVTSAAAALEAFGWARDGDELGSDPPNATITSPELEEPLVLELLDATVGDDRLAFGVRALLRTDPLDRDLTDLDVFIDGTSDDPGSDGAATAATLDPDAVAAAAGFDTPSSLASHLGALLSVVTADVAGSDRDGRVARLSVRAAFAVAPGSTGSVPVLMAQVDPAAFDPDAVAASIRTWMSTTGARVDALEFDLTISATDPLSQLVAVRDVVLPMDSICC